MSIAGYTWKRGDTGPAMVRTLRYSDHTVEDLSGATVKFILYAATAAGGKDPNGSDTVESVTVLDATGGRVSYSPTTAATLVAGSFLGEFKVLNGSVRTTFPNDGYIPITIVDDLGDQ